MKIFARKSAEQIYKEIVSQLSTKLQNQHPTGLNLLENANIKEEFEKHLSNLLTNQDYFAFFDKLLPLVRTLADDECFLNSQCQFRISLHLFRGLSALFRRK